MTKPERKYLLLVIALMLLICARGFGQNCSPTNPCAPGTVTDSNVPFTGDVATVLVCTSNCTPTTLTAYMANPAAKSPWSVQASFKVTSPSMAYHPPQAYGSSASYAVYITRPVSSLFTFQMPKAGQ